VLYDIIRALGLMTMIIITIPIQLFSCCVAIVDNMIAMFKSMSKSERAYQNAVRYFKKH
jgi:hypothetical protein